MRYCITSVLFIGLINCSILWLTLQRYVMPDYPWKNVRIFPPKLAPSGSFHKLIDLNNFDYLIRKSCDDSHSPNAIIVVHSAPRNDKKRKIIRETWGQAVPAGRLFFLLGAVNDSTLQKQLEQEDEDYQDIIQGNFHDSYRNMTYKHTMALKWFVNECPLLKYLIRVDDDVFLNSLVAFDLLEQGVFDEQNLILCHAENSSSVVRSREEKWGKWYVSFEEYPGQFYPPYCLGFAVIYSNDVVQKLYREAQKHKYFWIDDVWITGDMRKHINVNITDLENYKIEDSVVGELVDGAIDLVDVEPNFIFAGVNPEVRQRLVLWEMISSAQDSNFIDLN